MDDSYQAIADRVPPAAFCAIINIRNALRGKKHRIAPSPEAGIYRVTDGKAVLHICRRSRHNRSKRGIFAGIDALAAQYHLPVVVPRPGDVLVDCGANIGELGVWAKRHGMTYIPFEPETLEARCCDLNVFSGKTETNAFALWHEDTELKFFSKARSADSSLFEVNDYDDVKVVKARRLDASVGDIDPSRRIILKIEAEGAEPEVLAGASGLLKRASFVTVDCGYERGKDQTHTFVEANAALVAVGFEVIAADLRRMTFLYQNSAL
jgi:FkbM family methyltransferase